MKIDDLISLLAGLYLFTGYIFMRAYYKYVLDDCYMWSKPAVGLGIFDHVYEIIIWPLYAGLLVVGFIGGEIENR